MNTNPNPNDPTLNEGRQPAELDEDFDKALAEAERMAEAMDDGTDDDGGILAGCAVVILLAVAAAALMAVCSLLTLCS